MSTSEKDQIKQVNQKPQEPQEQQKQATQQNHPNKTPIKPRNSLDRSVNNLLMQAGNQNVGELIKKTQPLIDFFSNLIKTTLPYIQLFGEKAYNLYNSLPLDVIYALIGLCLAFFGGVYCLVVAAAETFYMTGYKNAEDMYYKLKTEMEIIWRANEEDNKIDADNSGKADILEMTVAEVAQRKFLLFLKSCRDPDLIMNMIPQMVACFISVIAVLKVQFAKVIALGHQIGESLRKPTCYFLVPTLGKIVPTEYQKWISPCIEFACKCVAISIAWLIQRIISSVQSAIRGGLMFSRNILKFANKQGYFPGYNEDDYIDEIIGWFVAFCGIYFQIMSGFGLPFPFNLFLFPISIMESYLQWVISE